MRIKLSHNFEEMINVDNLLLAWQEFIKGKKNKKDVREFSFNLMDNILSLRNDLSNHTYKHGGYQAFNICDPKPRNIHKASVRDRLTHHAVYRILYPFFERVFATDSFSCIKNKGTHKALNRFRVFLYRASKNNTKTCWVLKCDIKKFFASINQEILLEILRKYIDDEKILWLLEKIIKSFYSVEPGVGLPLGNLTSQLFVNIYMNEFDQFIKHELKIKHYIRYADDFIILSQDKKWLVKLVPKINLFLKNNLKLSIHSGKIFIRTIASGADFLGWINFLDHRIIRPVTKKRMLKRIKEKPNVCAFNSYIGLLKHGNTYKLKKKVLLLKIQN